MSYARISKRYDTTIFEKVKPQFCRQGSFFIPKAGWSAGTGHSAAAAPPARSGDPARQNGGTGDDDKKHLANPLAGGMLSGSSDHRKKALQ